MRRLRHWRDQALALALSRSVALGVPQFDNLTFALSSLMCRQQKTVRHSKLCSRFCWAVAASVTWFAMVLFVVFQNVKKLFFEGL